MSTPTTSTNTLKIPDIKVFLRLSRFFYAVLILELCVLILQTTLTFLSPASSPKEPPPIIDALVGVCLGGQLIYFLKWYYRSYKLFQQAQIPGLVYKPVLGIFMIFVPLVNLVIPYLTWIELYKASYPNPPEEGWKKVPIPWFLITRWILDILNTVLIIGLLCVSGVLVFLSLDKNPPDYLLFTPAMELLADWIDWVLLVATTWLWVKFVKTTHAHQIEKFASWQPLTDLLQDWPKAPSDQQ